MKNAYVIEAMVAPMANRNLGARTYSMEPFDPPSGYRLHSWRMGGCEDAPLAFVLWELVQQCSVPDCGVPAWLPISSMCPRHLYEQRYLAADREPEEKS